MTEVPCPECGATLEGPYEGRVACQACGCILIFEGDTVRIVQENHVKQIILGTKTQTRRNHNNVEDRAQQKKEAAFNQLHGPSRPHACSNLRTKMGAKSLSPFVVQYKNTPITGPHHHQPSEKSMGDAATPQSKSTRIWRARKKEQTMKSMAKRDTSSMPSDEYPLHPSSPTPSKEAED